MGLTWIDHDTIEKPIEEITLKKEDVGFEFTVETLKSANTEQASQVKKKIANKVSFYFTVKWTIANQIIVLRTFTLQTFTLFPIAR